MSGTSPPKKGWLAHHSELVAAWRRRNPQDGEDAMQDAVVGMLENGLGAVENPRGYLARSTSNGLVDRHRRRGAIDFQPLEGLGWGPDRPASGPPRCRPDRARSGS